MKVLVCGGRTYSDSAHVFRTLGGIHQETPITAVIHGGATGADRSANAWAETNDVAHWCFPARWRELGLKAGPIRNAEMLERGKPDLVIAFPGGRGTADMIAKAEAAAVPVRMIAARREDDDA